MRGKFWAYCLLSLLSDACTRDFSVFGFDHGGTTRRNPARTPDASEPDPVEPTETQDAAPAQPSDGGESTPPPPDAGGSQQTDPPPASDAAGHAAPVPDAPNKPAGQVDPPDAGDEDAGSVDSRAPECVASWGELPFPKPSDAGISDASDLPRSDPPSAQCQTCACDSCASAILDCLHNGSAVERGLCRDMLTCALRERCQEYDCYCASMGCGLPNGIGDGPCAEEINAAAGGNRSRVIALRNANPPDPKEPLVRAAQAIACILGEHPASPGPTLAGNCDDTCQ